MKDFNNEPIEWTRVWREEASREANRILFVGDSIIDGCKGYFSAGLRGEYAITAFVTSKGVNNPYFIKELDLLLEQEEHDYKLVYFNSGIHVHGQSAEEYKESYRALIREIQGLLPDTPIVLGLSTPLTEGNTAEAKTYDTPVALDETVKLTEQNKTVVEFNSAVLEIAKEEGLEVFDAYSLMLKNSQYKKADGVHFVPEGYSLMSGEIIKTIKKLLCKEESK